MNPWKELTGARYGGPASNTRYALTLLNGVLIMKFAKFNLKDIGAPKPANLFRFLFAYMYSDEILKYPDNKPAGQSEKVTKDEYTNRVHTTYVTGFTNGERFVAMGVYELRPINGGEPKYVHHVFLGRTRMAAMAHLQCGVRKHHAKEFSVTPIIERTMSLMNTMKIGTDCHEAYLQRKVGAQREAGSVKDTPAAE